MQRLGMNIGGYRGESIDIQQVLREIESVIIEKKWKRDRLRFVSETSSDEVDFIAYRRFADSARHRIYLSTGIHGDEPAGPLAVLQLLEEDYWPTDAAVWLCPCLNLSGFPLNQRENISGIDLNRDYRHLQTDEIRAHVKWLQQQPDFDVALCLHEDWEAQGFYLYELNPDNRPSLAPAILSRVQTVCPIDQSPVIENWPAQNGIIRPKIDLENRPQWPEALYLINNKTRLSYTLEAPSDFPLETRVSALVQAVRAVLETPGASRNRGDAVDARRV